MAAYFSVRDILRNGAHAQILDFYEAVTIDAHRSYPD